LRRFIAGAAAAALVLSACGGGSKSSSKTTSTSSTVPLQSTTTAPPPPAILTNLPQPDGSKLKRPVLVVKVENAPEARPQSGMDKADVVFEEVVEGGIVRFLCVFQSQDAGEVGPVRSVRPVDPDIVSPLGGLFAYSGGAPQFVKLIKRAPVRLVGFDEFTSAYTKKPGHAAPHNLYTSTSRLYERAKDGDKVPPPLFTFGTATGTPAVKAHVVMGGLTDAVWDWDPAISRWNRTTNGTAHVMAGGAQLSFANVVIQYVHYSNTSSVDPAGFPVPTASVIGTGQAVVLSGGTQVKANWTKKSAGDVTAFTDAAGLPVNFAPGPTWVMLAPVGANTQIS
jgi:hypothetical protein